MKPNLKGKPLPVQNVQPSFQSYMEEKLKSSQVRKIYEEAQNKQKQELPSRGKPFQIKSSQTSSSFSSSNSSKKPFNQFYQPVKIKTIDDSIPRPSSAKRQIEASYVSTQKSEEISNDIDSKSIHSETFSISKSSNTDTQNFKSFVEKKKQQINYDPGVWVKSTNGVKQKTKLQAKEFQDIMESVEKMIEQKQQGRSQIQEELGPFIKQQQNIAQNKFKQLDEEGELDKQISELGQELQEVEKATMEKRIQIDLERLKQIIEEPMDNDSFISIKQKSMFITELLKNREQLQSRLQNKQYVEQDQQSDFYSEAEQFVEQLEDKIEVREQDLLNIQQQILPTNYSERLDELLKDIDTFKPNQYSKITPYSMNKDQMKIINQKIKKINPNFKEDSDLELDQPGILPKDQTLRREAIDRIISIKNQQFNEELLQLAKKSGTLEERPKMQQLLESLRKSIKQQPSDFLLHKLQDFAQLDKMTVESYKLLETLAANNILQECQQQKAELDRAIQFSQQLLIQSSANNLEEQLEYIREAKSQLESLEGQFLDLYDQSCYVLQSELPQIHEVDEQNNEDLIVQIEQNNQYSRTIEDIDREITEKIRLEQPELFDEQEDQQEQEYDL